ncbi:glycosyl hydrolase [Mycena capillaripes]|nr:glycosyl hydrolase [Mycena capillaripes]
MPTFEQYKDLSPEISFSLTLDNLRETIATITRKLVSLLWVSSALVALSPIDMPAATYTNRTPSLYLLRISLLKIQRLAILPGNLADPWVFAFNTSYYLTPTMPDGSVAVFKSPTLDNFKGGAPVTVWAPPNPVTGVWAPELHIIAGDWYIYCALQDGEEDADRRHVFAPMHTLKGSDPTDPTAPFVDLGQIGTPDNNYAIDGTEKRELDTVQYLYIAEMDTPYSVVGERVLIHSPYWPNGTRKEWQWILVNGDQTFLLYSACGSWDACYSLGIMDLISPDVDPLDLDSWWANDDGPVFTRSTLTVGTGHASFPRDANGVPYITYHAWDVDAPAGWGSRELRTQRFDWNADGKPKFSEAVASGVELPAAGY